jgi:integrase
VEQTIGALLPHLDAGDIIIDGGNSYYRDTIRRAETCRESGHHLIDVGTSGGIWGLEEGYSMMVATEVGGRLIFGPPKNREARTVIVPRYVMDALQPLLNDKTADDLVFTALRGGPVRLNNFRRRIFSPAAARIGVPDLVPHDLRDTAASLAISSGASIKAVQRMLGHASAKMTLDVYGSLFEEDLEALADRLEERYGGL